MLPRFSCLFLVGLMMSCGVAEEGIPAPNTALSFPVGLAAHPDGRFLYIANSVFDRRYKNGTVVVYDAEQGALLPNATFSTGLFAGELIMGRQGPDLPVYGYVASRETNQIVQFGVDASAGDSGSHLTAASNVTSFGGRSFADDPYGIALDPHGL